MPENWLELLVINMAWGVALIFAMLAGLWLLCWVAAGVLWMTELAMQRHKPHHHHSQPGIVYDSGCPGCVMGERHL